MCVEKEMAMANVKVENSGMGFIVLVNAKEDSKTSDNGDSEVGGTGIWSLFCTRIQTAP